MVGTTAEATDRQLLQDFSQRSDQAAFAEIVRRHGPMVYSVCRRMLGNDHDAEDAFQAAFLVLARKGASLPNAAVANWLYGVACRSSLKARSMRAKRQAREARAAIRVEPQACDEERWDDVLPILDEELSRLPDRYRVPIVLCDLEGRSQREVAELLGWQRGTVSGRLVRGRRLLAQRLTRRGVTMTGAALGAILVENLAAGALPVGVAVSAIPPAATAAGVAGAGVASSKAAILADGVLKTMLLTKLGASALVLLTAVIGSTIVLVASDPEDAAPALQSADGMLTARGIVRMPVESPAAGAIVTYTEEREANAVHANSDGRFELSGSYFGGHLGSFSGGHLHARSANDQSQALVFIPESTARTLLQKPLEIPLAPARTLDVTVTYQGIPVEGAHVAAVWSGRVLNAATDGTGRTKLLLPASDPVGDLVAWHPRVGLGGMALEEGDNRKVALVSLLPAAPFTVRIEDVDGHPVPDTTIAVSALPRRGDWLGMLAFEAARLRTDAEGQVVVPWVPQDLKSVDVHVFDPGLIRVGIDNERQVNAERSTTLRVTRAVNVVGRVEVPPGANAEGILVSGRGNGPLYLSHRPTARTQRDGFFHLKVAPDWGYGLAVSDAQWATEWWAGVPGDASSSRIVLKAYEATPLTVHVTHGTPPQPLEGSWVEIESRGSVNWRDPQGELQDFDAPIGGWYRTDADGKVAVGVARGTCQVRVSAWDETRTAEVTSSEPLVIEFHRP